VAEVHEELAPEGAFGGSCGAQGLASRVEKDERRRVERATYLRNDAQSRRIYTYAAVTLHHPDGVSLAGGSTVVAESSHLRGFRVTKTSDPPSAPRPTDRLTVSRG
jgi:hypothetical protein